jgi:ABC transport system ATP-binding/permease protein
MPLLLNGQDLSKAYGAEPLFEDISLTISDGDRWGLIGPNGSGKTTFLQILAGLKEPDSGTCAYRKLVKSGYVPQEAAFPAGRSVRDILWEALAETEGDDHEKEGALAETLGRVGFPDSSVPAADLSGGWKKRLAIARELVRHPDILLLDEPTNHLDLEGILWLEKLLKSAPFACVVVSHDRYFLENVATYMAELNRVYPGGMLRVKGNYSEFLERKEGFLTAQAKHQEALQNKVHRELEWLRRGPKARTTKSKARIDAAGRLMDELADVQARSREATAKIDFTASDRKTRKLTELRGVSKSLGGRTLFRDLDMKLSPGVRLGLTGLNGTGKTTLLRILAGEIEPDEGEVERADLLRVVYFDQYRQQLDLEASLRRALAPDGDSVIYRDKVIHAAGWARRFLFRPEQFEVAVGQLSGGERARVLIARLMLQPADVLLLDEPTNDLDIPTLETLEESLLDFPGALVLVTHDRYMLDRVSTHVLGLDGEGGAQYYADYSQWQQQQEASQRKPARAEAPIGARSATAEESATALASGKRKLSYLENREWESMEQRIEEAEAHLSTCRRALEESSARGDAAATQTAYDAMLSAQQAVDTLYQRWAELEAKLAP